MTTKSFTVRAVETQQELKAMLYQRWLVLREPLGLPLGTESDRYDDIATHLIAVISGDSAARNSESADSLMPSTAPIVGSARLRELSPTVGGIAYVAVLPEFQHQGIGSALVQQLIELAKAQSFSQLRVMSRLPAAHFYRRFGFVEQGEPITYLDTPHWFMYLNW
jgi:ribosomal protein S18 acetylase RimI-like enzyme